LELGGNLGLPARRRNSDGVFVRIQARAAHPLLPLRILLDRNRGAAYVAIFIAGGGIFGVNLFLTY
jgi:hypothetical protein